MNMHFQPDSLPIRFLTRTCDLILLNVMLLLSCATIVCSGSAITALYFVTLKMMRGEAEFIAKDFFRQLRKNFIPSFPATILLFIDLLLAALLCHALYAEILVFSPELFVLLVIFAVLLTALLSYLFPLLARYENPFLRQVRNAAYLAAAHLPVTILITAVNLLPIWFGLLFPGLWIAFIEFWLFIGAAAGAYLNSFYLQRIFESQTPSSPSGL